MKTYTYKFADGIENSVEIEDSLYDEIRKMDLCERINNRKETRRHISLEYLQENGVDFPDPNADLDLILERLELAKKMDEALDTLTERQREVFTYYALNNLSCREIGEKLGITTRVACGHYNAARRKLKKFFENYVQNCDFRGYK